MKWLMFIMVSIMMVGLVSAQQGDLGTFKQGECVTLIQTCATCTFNNITSVLYPNLTVALPQVAMIKNGTQYTYPFCSTDATGLYTVNGIGDDSGTNIWVYTFEVNGLGQQLTTSQSIVYVVIFFVSLLAFIITLVIGIALPYKNKTDEMTGYVLAVENLKYFKMFCLAISYLILMLIFYFGWMISYAYLGLTFVGDLLRVGFWLLIAALVPLFVLSLYLLIANAVRDAKIGEALERGLSVQDGQY